MLRAALLGQRKFASGNLDDDRHEVFRVVKLEVVDLHRDGQLGDGIAEHERIFELALLIGDSELAEDLACVITCR